MGSFPRTLRDHWRVPDRSCVTNRRDYYFLQLESDTCQWLHAAGPDLANKLVGQVV